MFFCIEFSKTDIKILLRAFGCFIHPNTRHSQTFLSPPRSPMISHHPCALCQSSISLAHAATLSSVQSQKFLQIWSECCPIRSVLIVISVFIGVTLPPPTTTLRFEIIGPSSTVLCTWQVHCILYVFVHCITERKSGKSLALSTMIMFSKVV